MTTDELLAQSREMLNQSRAIQSGTQTFAGSVFDKPTTTTSTTSTSGNMINAGYQAALRGTPISLPTYSAPTSASRVTQYPVYQAPKTQIGVTTPTPALATDAGTQALLTAEDEATKQRLALEAERTKQAQTWTDKILGAINNVSSITQSAMEQQNKVYERFVAESKARSEEIKTFKDQYANVEALMNQQLQDAQGRQAPMSFINNQQSQIRNNAAPELNRLSAHINTLAAAQAAAQGDYNLARSHIQDAVDNVTALAKFQYDAYSEIYKNNQDSFDRVDSIYRDAFVAKMNLAKDAYDTARAEKMQIGELMLKYPNAGLSMSDTLDEAFKKASSFSGTTVGTSTAGTYSTRADQILDGFITLNDLTPAEAAKVRDELYARGFGSDVPPDWYKQYLEESMRMSLLPSFVKEEWIKYRDSLIHPEGSKTSSTLSFDAL